MKLKRSLAAVVFCTMLLSLLQPATVSAYAATKYFTYSEQGTGASVQSLSLEPGESVDLKFIGVMDYKDYELRWISSNENVATVNSVGVVQAKKTGSATITLIVGDGTDYTSRGVLVTVSERGTVSLGTASNNTFTSAELGIGTTMDLAFYGVDDWSSSRYKCSWVSTNPEVATVDKMGVVTTVRKGTTYIILSITDKFTSKSLDVEPMLLTVVKNAMPSPTPTMKPEDTALLTVTPTPTPAVVNYAVVMTSMNSFQLVFSRSVNYKKEDITLYLLDGYTASERDFTISWNESRTEADVTVNQGFYNGDEYRIHVGDKDDGTTFITEFGTPARVEVVYECMGKENVAYAWPSGEVDMPVTLSYRLYDEWDVDVTSEFKYGSNVEYELISPEEADYLYFYDDTLYFYEEGRSATVCATVTYTENGETKELKSDALKIKAEDMGSYSIKVDKWTIVDADNQEVDWNNPNHSVMENAENAQIVLLLTDMFGIRYSSDYIGADESEDIYELNDTSKFFANSGYLLEYTSGNEDVGYVGQDGVLSVYEDASKLTVSVMLHNYNDYDYRGKKIGTLSVQIKDAPKLAKIKADKTAVTLASDCLPGYENRFCEADIDIQLFDQYGNAWTGSHELTATCSNENITANLTGTTLHINAADIAAQNLTSVTFTVKELDIKKSVSIRVTLAKPSYVSGSTTEILETGWKISANNVDIVFDDDSYTKSSVVEVIRQSKNVDVGLCGNISYIEKSSYRPSATDPAGAYVLITGPDGKPVPSAGGTEVTGVSVENGTLSVNVAGAGSSGIEFLDAGTYRIKAYIVEYDEDDKQIVTKKDASFTVKNNIPKVSFRSLKGNETNAYVYSDDDITAIGEIIEELFVFTKDGKQFTVTADMVESASISWRERYIVIRSVEIRVPVGKNDSYYLCKVSGINKSIYHGVEDYYD